MIWCVYLHIDAQSVLDHFHYQCIMHYWSPLWLSKDEENEEEHSNNDNV